MTPHDDTSEIYPGLHCERFIDYRRAEPLQRQIRDFGDGINIPPKRFMYVCGPTGVGKTQLLAWSFDPDDFKVRVTATRRLVPIVYSRVPDRGTMHGFCSKLLKQLGGASNPRETIDALVDRIQFYLETHKTKLLIIDEAQHFERSGEYPVADVLKGMVEEFPCRILLAGVYDLVGLVSRNPQLAGRLIRSIMVKPFDWFNPADQDDYRGFLHTIQCGAPETYADVDISAMGLAGCIHLASRGLLRATTNLLALAKIEAHEAGRRAITTDDLSVAFYELNKTLKPMPDDPFQMRSLPATWEPAPITEGIDMGKRPSRPRRR
ncbi:TniB family NTP-binding protein [Dongia sp.]|uniref:TniB family NTP-binding protein n=1 Tax=Dongia sp. TaxID=1977262 RepID=UPI0035AFD661